MIREPETFVFRSLSLVAVLAWSTLAFGACVPARHRECVDLSAIPEIARQVIAPEKIPKPTDKARPTLPGGNYTGPTIGMSNAVRRAPEVGYRWSID